MDRRNFLRTLIGGLAGTAAASTLDLDKLLWVPGAKTFFLPSAPLIHPDYHSFTVGDIFQIEGQFATNPLTGLSTGYLQHFVITADNINSADIFPPVNASLLKRKPKPLLTSPTPGTWLKHEWSDV